MRLELDTDAAAGYRSPAQRARRVTEAWFAEAMYCPACPNDRLERARASTPVVDFVCSACGAEYQLKARAGPLGRRLRDAAYDPMMARVAANRSPHFAFLGYDTQGWRVRNLLLVPGYFITPDVIERCKPLSSSARRAGWVGCNILAHLIPPDGRLAVVTNGSAMPPAAVRSGWRLFADLSHADAKRRGWTVDVLRCVRAWGGAGFTAQEFYGRFEADLARRHPDNRNVQPKIRQQLQVLRDRGVVRFLGRGRYVAE